VKITPSKIISLLFFIFSGFYLYTAYQIQVFAFDEGAAFNARTFPIYLGFAGLFFSGLFVILPETNPSSVDLKVLDYKKTLGLVILMILYGITILKVGFFLSTSIFLVGSYIF
jgi:putative tricarboxylic transport membrane protein